jgi:hypothetical protein
MSRGDGRNDPADGLPPPQAAGMSCYSVAEEITSICADFLVELRGFEPLTSAVLAPTRWTAPPLASTQVFGPNAQIAVRSSTTWRTAQIDPNRASSIGQKSSIFHGRDDVGLDLARHWSRPELLGECGCRSLCRFR